MWLKIGIVLCSRWILIVETNPDITRQWVVCGVEEETFVAVTRFIDLFIVENFTKCDVTVGFNGQAGFNQTFGWNPNHTHSDRFPSLLLRITAPWFVFLFLTNQIVFVPSEVFSAVCCTTGYVHMFTVGPQTSSDIRLVRVYLQSSAPRRPPLSPFLW